MTVSSVIVQKRVRKKYGDGDDDDGPLYFKTNRGGGLCDKLWCQRKATMLVRYPSELTTGAWSWTVYRDRYYQAFVCEEHFRWLQLEIDFGMTVDWAE